MTNTAGTTDESSPPVNLRFLWQVATVLLLSVLALDIAQASNRKLDKIHQEILEKYPRVSHVQSELLAAASSEVLYFDVREIDEYQVSHLSGATQLNPDITLAQFEARFGDEIAGKTLIFYCSVGRRASRLIDRLHPVLSQVEGTRAMNLEGGIFRWHNDERSLVQDRQPTDKVHPFNWFNSRLLVRRSKASYSP